MFPNGTDSGHADIFDVLREIDAILGRIPQPLACPESVGAALLSADMTPNVVAANSALASPRAAPRVSLQGHGRAVALANLGRSVRALELTLAPEGGPVRVVGARVTHRAGGFLVDYHQANATAPVKVLLVSLTGDTIPPGRGTVARLRVASGATRGGQLRLKEVRVAE